MFGAIPLAGTSYAAGCYGASCDNQGPKGTGCDDDAITKYSTSLSDRVVQLRGSVTCRAAWARVTNNADPSVYPSYATIEKYDGNGRLLKSLTIRTPTTGQTDWTNMLGGEGVYFRACIRIDAGSSPISCTDKW
ncbi:DUF2690 domain-containing protein [Streptomyces morookaense]|uniref:DUF2690 domain-containing protein n=1 Tax=Streptomyces morookaense TaxID=1970 RepID=UPI003407B4F3